MIAGDWISDRAAVEKVVREAPAQIKQLIEWGVNFDKKADGEFDLHKEGGHSEFRILHHKDNTGAEIQTSLIRAVQQHPNITIFKNHFAVEIITQHHLGIIVTRYTPGIKCFGAYVLNEETGEVDIAMYLQGEAIAQDLAKRDPAALASPSAVAALSQNLSGSNAGTSELDLLREPPQEMGRYYYALLGYTCIMCAEVAKTLIERTRSGASALGDRCQVSATPPGRQLVAALVASWLIVMASTLTTVAYLWLVAGVSFGGRIWLTPVACAAISLVSCAFGALIGSLPGATPRVKDALVTICTLGLSLPAGLFGEPAVERGNWLTQNVPLLQLVNPATQASEALFALTFYDSLVPFAQALAALVTIAAVFAAGSVLCMRRTRHAYR